MRTPLLVLLAATPALATPPQYEPHILPGLGGTIGRALGVNSSGMVVGEASRTSQSYEVAVVWINGQPIELTGTGISIAGAESVNDSGVVVGISDSLGGKAFRAVPPSVPAALIPGMTNTTSQAYSINMQGHIVGSYYDIHNGSRPFVLRSGVFTPLPILGGYQGVGEAISNTGIIVGWTDLDSGGHMTAVRWINDQPTALVGGASVNIAYGVNDEGWTVGYVSGAPFGAYEASLWTDPATRISLGAINGSWSNIARDINNHRQIVGISGSRGFIWENGQIRDLNTMISPSAWPTPGWTISDARAITDTGIIAAQATHAGQSSAVLLVPNCSADFNHDGDTGTDQDIAAFFACLSGTCCPSCNTADFNADGDTGTDQDIESFFRVLGGGSC